MSTTDWPFNPDRDPARPTSLADEPVLPEIKLPLLPAIKGLTDQREVIFCREMARLNDPLAAAITAQISVQGQPMRIAAERLLLRPEIQAAIVAQRKILANAPAVEITKHSLTADADEVKRKAMARSDFTNALAAIKLQAGLHGLLVSKVEVSREISNADELTTEELVAEIRSRRRSDDGSGSPPATPIAAPPKMIDITPDHDNDPPGETLQRGIGTRAGGARGG